MAIEIRTLDHPEANGRKPQPGETEYAFTFRAENNEIVILRMGSQAWEIHSQHVLDMLAETPSYNDGSLG